MTHTVRVRRAAGLIVVGSLVALAPTASARPLPQAPGCPVFPPATTWNQRVDRLPVAAGSKAFIASSGIRRLHPDFSDSDADGYGIPFNVVDSTTPRATVAFDYADESDAGPYPIPDGVAIEGGGDRHILLVDRSTCTLSELFAAERTGARSWRAGSGARWDLRSTRLRPAGWTSADAAGLPILPGLARHDEVAVGVGGIDHALRITVPTTQRAYLWPARHHASSVRAPSAVPMGLRIRVRASYDTRRFGPQTRAILEAGKRYGFIVADNGSAGFISGAPSPGWNDDDLHALHNVPASALEVVDTSSLVGTPAVPRAWNIRWTTVAGKRRATMLLSRSGRVTITARVGGKVVARKQVRLKQGFVAVAIAARRGATYRLTFARP